MEMGESKLKEYESKISKLEKQINPLLDENDRVCFRSPFLSICDTFFISATFLFQRRMDYILTQIIEKVKIIPEAQVFLKPVNKKQVQNYYDVITNPMDLETIANRINSKLKL